MARVVFSLTTAQVEALAYVKKNGQSAYGDYGACDGLVTRGLAQKLPNKGFRVMRLTKSGQLALTLADALGLTKKPAAPKSA
jgi:hypothetical protein